MLGGAQDLLDPFLYGEQRGFAGVSDYGNNYPIEQFAAPLDNVCVTESNGVKAAWIDCNHKFCPTESGRVGEPESGRWESGRVEENLHAWLIPLTSVKSVERIRCRTSFYFLMEWAL